MVKVNKPSYLSLDGGQREGLKSFLSRGDGFYHVQHLDLDPFIPGGLLTKWDSALAIVSGSGTSNGVLVLLGHRIDLPADMLDHHPYAVAFSGSEPGHSAVLVDHLSTVSRSLGLPSEFTAGFWASGVSNYFYNNPPYGVSSGSLPDLPEAARAALGAIVHLIPKPSSGSAV